MVPSRLHVHGGSIANLCVYRTWALSLENKHTERSTDASKPLLPGAPEASWVRRAYASTSLPSIIAIARPRAPKRRLLDEFCQVPGRHRKSAIPRLGQAPRRTARAL